jgi:hypothetical protein
MANMTLQFIIQGSQGINKTERRKIRSHVMQGKNAGRPRPSTKRPTGSVHNKRSVTCRSAQVPDKGFGDMILKTLLWNDLSLTSFPQQLDPESTKLMHRCEWWPNLPSPSAVSLSVTRVLRVL